MKQIFDQVSVKTSRITTKSYSTSFSMGIRFLHKDFRDPIYSIYGFVRFADEIVDTFHDYDKDYLLSDFRRQTNEALDQKISLNPILNAFQEVVNTFNIDRELVDTFLDSMEMDLDQSKYSEHEYEKYILGSAEVVGLMCLKIFVEGNQRMYDDLKHYAMKLGAAFQKINFLRDLKNDYQNLGRVYFPGVDMKDFSDEIKKEIERNIEIDFKKGYEGILLLPKKARFGVYMAYIYYFKLFTKIKSIPAHRIKNERVRIPNERKYALFLSSYLKHSLNIV